MTQRNRRGAAALLLSSSLISTAHPVRAAKSAPEGPSSTIFTFEFVPEKHEKAFRDYLDFTQKTVQGVDSLRTQYLIAEMCMFREDYKKASEILQNLAAVVLDDEFFNISILQRLADCYMHLGLFEQAAQAYASVSKSDIKVVIPEAILGLAVASLAGGDREQAYLRFQELVSFYPSYKTLTHAMLPLGIIQWENRRFADAADYFARDEKNPASIYFLGVCQRAIKKSAEAMTTFHGLIQRYPKTVWAERAKFEIGETFFQQNDYNLTVRSFDEFLRNKPGDLWQTLAYYRLACNDFKVDRFKEAEQRFAGLSRKMQKHPHHDNVNYLLSESLAQQNKMPQLVKFLQNEIKGKEKSPDNMYRLIWAFTAVGQYDQAISLSNEFLNNTWDAELTPKALLIQGYAFGQTKKDPEAVASYQLVVDKFPESPYAAQATHLMAVTYFRSNQYGPVVTQVNHQWNGLSMDVKKKHPDAQFWIGEANLQLQNGKEARDNYQKFLDMAPPDHPMVAEAMRGEAVGWVVDRDYNNAVLSLQKSIATAQERKDDDLAATLTYELGNIYFNAKDFENAAGSYRAHQKMAPKHRLVPDSLYQEGLALHRAEYYSDAITAWEKLAKSHPRHEKTPDALFRMGKTRFDTGQYAEAVKDYGNLVRSYPKSPLAKDARLQIGQSYYNAGDFNKAIVAYQDFLNRYPSDEQSMDVLQLLQTSYFRANKKPEEIERLTRNQPKSAVLADIYWEEGAKLYNEKKYDQAREYFQKILFEFPSSAIAPQAGFYRAESLYLQEKFPDAIPAFENYIQGYPEDSNMSLAKFHYAVSLFNENQFADSGKAFQDFAENYPDDPMAKNALQNVALCYAKDQDVDAAMDAYRNYAQKFPNSEDIGAVYTQMAGLVEKSGDLKKAAEAYESVPSNLPEYPEALLNAGRLYRMLNDTEGEQRIYEKLQRLPKKDDPYRINGLLQLGEIYMTQNQGEKALAVYQDVAKNATDEQSAALAQERIGQLQGGAQ